MNEDKPASRNGVGEPPRGLVTMSEITAAA